MWSAWVRSFALLCLVSSCQWVVTTTAAYGYESKIHQQLTFVAARQFNRCMQNNTAIARFSALDTRYIVKANTAQADGNIFRRMFRWNYYNRATQKNRVALWLIDTRFHSHFNYVERRIERRDERKDRMRDLGKLLNYVQDVTSPAHVVPVYTNRWWRWSWSDKFDRYPVDQPRLEAALQDTCEYVTLPAAQFQDVLVEVANDTIMAVQGKILGFPTTWESYWRFAKKPESFGDYGSAGNAFGDHSQFKCGEGQRCLLLKDDPLYRNFAHDRHVAAAIGSMRAMFLLQSGYQPIKPPTTVVDSDRPKVAPDAQ